jgi:hypothetical protein
MINAVRQLIRFGAGMFIFSIMMCSCTDEVSFPAESFELAKSKALKISSVLRLFVEHHGSPPNSIDDLDRFCKSKGFDNLLYESKTQFERKIVWSISEGESLLTRNPVYQKNGVLVEISILKNYRIEIREKSDTQPKLR